MIKIKKIFLHHWPIILIWMLGFFLRCYRQGQLLGFYYDQGRDAKMALDILTARNFPAIGPATGIEGLHLGPFWYYLITPGYFFGQGNPAVAACFISFLESLTIPLIFFIVKKHHRQSAYLAGILWAFSHYLIRSSRWFSNPSPLPFFVLLIIFCLIKIIEDKNRKYWPLLLFFLGLSLQLEAASAIFFIPVIIVLVIINRRRVFPIKFKIYLNSLLAFTVLLLPQLAFEIKNKFPLFHSLSSYFSDQKANDVARTWAWPDLDFLKVRLPEYFRILFSKLDTNLTSYTYVYLFIFIFSALFLFLRHRRSKLVQIILTWLFLPLFTLLFFTGKFGVLYDYYLTGFFPAFIIIFSLSLSLFKNKNLSFFIFLFIIVLFYQGNYVHLKNYLIAGVDGPEHITLGNQKQAVEYICQQTQDKKYNLDIYVPPIIPYSYNYLFDWYHRRHLCFLPTDQTSNLVYTLHEVDLPHPERPQLWLQSKVTTETIIKELKFGGITVQQRQKNDKQK